VLAINDGYPASMVMQTTQSTDVKNVAASQGV
jgi:hypothetical protein